jgi:serine/threonine protein kinase
MLDRTIANDFRIVRRLAAGTMGTVYVAEQVSTGKLRALKVLHSEFALDDKHRERFVREARAGSAIRSEHVVEVVSAGVDEATGVPWLAMELLEGRDLASVVRQRGALPPGEVLEILLQVGHGLGAAHRAGLVHRDLKPENVFLAESRRVGARFTVKVLDFGIAKIVMAGTLDGTQPIGTPLWMAPEQATEGGPLGPATDVWPLGLIAFQLLTGKMYWKSVEDETASVLQLLNEIAMAPIEPASARAARYGARDKIPRGFDAWFARCVARSIDARFRDAGAAVDALAPVLAPRRARGGVVALGVGVVAVVVVAVLVAARLLRWV